jgi:hypothetical protein
MALETIGVILMNWEHWRDKQSGSPLTGVAYMAVREQADGKLKSLRDGEAQRHHEMGFKPVVSVKSQVTHNGSKTTFTNGYEFFMVEGIPEAVVDTIKHLTTILVDGLIEPYYDQVGGTKGPLAEAKTRG